MHPNIGKGGREGGREGGKEGGREGGRGGKEEEAVADLCGMRCPTSPIGVLAPCVRGEVGWRTGGFG